MNVVDKLRLPGLEDALFRVERALATATRATDPFLSEVAGHLVSAGGKRLRPALVVAAAAVSGPARLGVTGAGPARPGVTGAGASDAGPARPRVTGAGASDAGPARLGVTGAGVSDEVIQGGVAVELVHLGSLYHDDVMDEAEYRRGVQSVNAKWGNLVAILAGDFLLARASEIAASLGTEVAGLLARTIGDLCEGEVGQLQYAFDPSRPEAAYLSSIAGKTASLMATSARIGALVAGAPRRWVDALTDYGRSLGMAFQIWDDVRDLVCSEEHLGKPAGHDMVEGTYTLPVLRALIVPGAGDDLRALLGAPLDAPARDKARDLVLSTPAVSGCITEARRWAGKADRALDLLREEGGSTEYLTVLGQVGDRLIDELESC